MTQSRIASIPRILALALVAIPALAALTTNAAANYGAFAYSNNTVRWGTSWGYATPQAARQAAINNCRSSDCTIRHNIPPGQCFAVVHGDPGRVAWGWGATREVARQQALGRCVRDGNSKCEIPSGNGSLFCNGSAPRPQPPRPSGQFTVLHGTDLFGADYRRVPGWVSYDRCLGACRRDGRCRAFTYNTKAGACFLKSWVPQSSPFNGAISGIKR